VTGDDRAAGTAAAYVDRVCAGTTTPEHELESLFTRIDATHHGTDGLNAIVHVDRDVLHQQPVRLHDRDGSTRGLLDGLPVVVKDNIATLRMPTACASEILRGYVSPVEATAVAKLRSAGALIVAKTNMDEFGMGSSTENSVYGPARNPHDVNCVPGGSSGGSAAAVAAGITRIALGSETGGSVRQPAAFCGIVGIKPTYGRVSRRGLVAFASSLDQVGVFGRCVDDAALALRVIAGHDPLDATSVDVAVPDYTAEGRGSRSLAGLTVGIPREYFPESLDPQIAALCARAANTLRTLGAEVREVAMPHTALAIPVYYIIAPAEASSNLARFDGVRYGHRADADSVDAMYLATRTQGFGAEVTRRILLGTYVISAGYYDAYYRRAQAVRQLITSDFDAQFSNGVDLLLTPTTPTTAFPIGSRSDPYDMYLSDIFTVTANLAGVPAMSLPVGRVDGMPVGAQLIAPRFAEATMLRAAYALEHALGEDAHR
jgi:aspartyl-tRNA(Asn)/glutamyl-tRNA(Gln) amidotransferase subunit A